MATTTRRLEPSLATPPSAGVMVFKRFVAGTCSGTALVLVGHPLDTLKVRLQVGPETSLVACAKSLWRSNGVRAFYRGMASPLVLTGGINTVLWGMQFNLCDRIGDRIQDPTKKAMAAALVSGVFISVLVTPMEGIKSRMQVEKGSEGSIAVAKRIVRDTGVFKGLYRGFTAVIMCRASNFAYFGGYAFVETRLRSLRKDLQPSSWRVTRDTLLAGGSAGVLYWIVAFPFDVIKARMMTAPENKPYTSMMHAAKVLYQDQGLRGFTRGFAPCALRAFPANAAAFSGFEIAMWLMG